MTFVPAWAAYKAALNFYSFPWRLLMSMTDGNTAIQVSPIDQLTEADMRTLFNRMVDAFVQHSGLAAEVDRLSDQVQELSRAVHEHGETVTNLTRERDEWQSKYSGSDKVAMEELGRRLEAENSLREARAEIDRLRSEHVHAVTTLEGRLQDKTNDYNDACAELKATQDLLDQTQAELAEARKDRDNAREANSVFEQRHIEIVAGHDAKVEAMRRDHERASGDAQYWRSRAERAEEKVSSIKKVLDTVSEAFRPFSVQA